MVGSELSHTPGKRGKNAERLAQAIQRLSSSISLSRESKQSLKGLD